MQTCKVNIAYKIYNRYSYRAKYLAEEAVAACNQGAGFAAVAVLFYLTYVILLSYILDTAVK